MTFSEAVKTCLAVKYANFNDRASRSEYWWFALFNSLVFVVGVIPMMLADKGKAMDAGTIFSVVFLVIAVLALLLPSVGVAVRRLHDLNYSGWWYVAVFIPYVGGLAGLAMMIIFCMRGTSGPNRFGGDPLVPEAERLAQQF